VIAMRRALASIRVLVGGWSIVGATLLCSPAADAQTSPLGTPVETWVPNGSVTSLTLDGHVLYIGGAFDQVNLPTGTFASVDVSAGTTITAGAGLNEPVTAIAPDGSGGWYVATLSGGFDTAEAHLDHVLPSGQIDPTWIRPDFSGHPVDSPPPPARGSIVTTVILEGGRLFAGGAFSTVNGLPRPGIVALEPLSGTVLPWTADLAFTLGTALPSVTGIAASPGRLYLSGLFSHVGGMARTNFAVVDAATGSALPPTLPSAGGFLRASVVTATRVYLYGNCRTDVYEICGYDLDMVPLPGWTFPFANQLLGPLAASDTALFASYVSLDLPSGERTVKLDAATGVELAWPEVTTTGGVVTLTAAGGRLYLAGRFTTTDRSGHVSPRWMPRPACSTPGRRSSAARCRR
jgi:hypothetical protein